jgi:Fic family protein
MADDLPTRPDLMFRGGQSFATLERARGLDLSESLARFDSMLDLGEGNVPAGPARAVITEATVSALLNAHRALFPDSEGSGTLRVAGVSGVFSGQDCPEPEHLPHSLRNLEHWLTAESFLEIHPIEQAALSLTRLVDIWPFEAGNRTAAVVFSNQFLLRAGLPPFFVLGEQVAELDEILAQAVRMQTEPLVRAIYRCLERELELVGR